LKGIIHRRDGVDRPDDGDRRLGCVPDGLANLDLDPGESSNRVADEPAPADELERKLYAHFQSIGHDLDRQSWETGLNPVYPSQAKDSPPK